MTEVPLIFTSKGNVPVDSLSYETAWEVTPDYIKFVERHRDGSGEVVKESAHVYDLRGVMGAGIAGSIGG